MMGRQNDDQGHLFYEFCLDEAVPDDHLVRKIDAVLDLSWVHAELAPHYPTLGRPSVDPALMIRMLIIGYVFGLRSERLLCQNPFSLGIDRINKRFDSVFVCLGVFRREKRECELDRLGGGRERQ